MTPVLSIQGRAVVDITYRSAAGASVPLMQTNSFIFDQAQCVQRVNGWKIWALGLKAVTKQAYQQILVPLSLTSDRRVQIRWGIDTGTQTLWTAWESARILRLSPLLGESTASPGGFTFTLTLVDLLYDMNLPGRVIARKGKISDLITAIAGAYQLQTLAEPTQGVPLHLVQAYQSDFEFMLERLLPLASNGASQASYYFYIQGNVLHFHTRGYQQSQQGVAYNIDSMHVASELIAVDEAQEQARLGGSAVSTVAYDPLQGITQVLKANPQTYARFGTQLSQAAGSILRSAHIGPNQAAAEAYGTQSIYSRARDEYERISLALVNVISVLPGSILNFQLPDGLGYSTGPYHVDKVSLSITGGEIQVVASASRGELQGSRPSSTTAVAAGSSATVSSLYDAPGSPPVFVTSSATGSLGAGAPVTVLPAG